MIDNIILNKGEHCTINERTIYKGEGPAIILKGDNCVVSGYGELISDNGILVLGNKGVIRDVTLKGGGIKVEGLFNTVTDIKISWADTGIFVTGNGNYIHNVLMWKIKKYYYLLKCTETAVIGGFCHVAERENVVTVHIEGSHNIIMGLISEPIKKSYAMEINGDYNQIIGQFNCTHFGYNKGNHNFIRRRGDLNEIHNTNK
jgi:hypothetical protein